MPSPIGKVEGRAWKRGRAGEDHVEIGAGSNRRHQVRGHGRYAIAEPICDGIFSGRAGSIRIDIDCHDVCRAGPGRGEREDAGTGADVSDPLSGQVPLANKSGEKLAGQEVCRMKDGWADGKSKAGRVGDRRPPALEDEMIRQAMDGFAK